MPTEVQSTYSHFTLLPVHSGDAAGDAHVSMVEARRAERRRDGRRLLDLWPDGRGVLAHRAAEDLDSRPARPPEGRCCPRCAPREL